MEEAPDPSLVYQVLAFGEDPAPSLGYQVISLGEALAPSLGYQMLALRRLSPFLWVTRCYPLGGFSPCWATILSLL